MKTKLVIFFDWQWVVHKEFAPEGRTINSWLLKRSDGPTRLWHVRPDNAQSGYCFLQHNNAHSHNATFVKQFLAKKSVTFLYRTLTRQIWHLRTTFYSLKWNPTLWGDVSTQFQTPEQRDEWIKEYSGSCVLRRQSEVLCPCKQVYRVGKEVCWRLRSNKFVFLQTSIFYEPSTQTL